MTGIAFGWIAATSLFGSVVRKPERSFVASPSFTFRTDVQLVQIPAKKASGRLSSKANLRCGDLDIPPADSVLAIRVVWLLRDHREGSTHVLRLTREQDKSRRRGGGSVRT